MEKLLYSVRDLFTEFLRNGEWGCYNIPEYQRGYKWTDYNVRQLLEDLSNFKKSSTDDFYCLQNITVTEGYSDGQKCLNVIDGQQRLTTLFILLSFLQLSKNEKFLEPDTLKYSVRKSTHTFLNEKVRSGAIWNGQINPEEQPSKDQYYLALVCKAVKEWFDCHELDATVILDDLKLIVNKVDSSEEETVFASLNGGKVDLDGADLVRAILITRASRQKFAEDSVLEKIGNFRIKLGIEIDEMNLWWAQPEVKMFFERLLPNRISQNKMFQYERHPIDLLYFAFFEVYKHRINEKRPNEDLDVRHFENGIDVNGKAGDNHFVFYTEISEFHMTMVDWYGDDETFNLLGYLMSNFKSAKLNFGTIWSWWEECNTKTAFRNRLKSEIRTQLANAFCCGENSADKFQQLQAAMADFNSTNWYEHDLTKVILPLADILPVEIKDKKTIKRVSCMDFKCSSLEDKEHVRSQSRNFDKENLTEEQKKILLEENNLGLNSLGNIVLLHRTVNRSYGNSKHCLKMNRIISEFTLEEIHIRPHTFDVFRSKLENMDGNGLAENEIFWSEEDIRRTAKQLSERIGNYLTVK